MNLGLVSKMYIIYSCEINYYILILLLLLRRDGPQPISRQVIIQSFPPCTSSSTQIYIYSHKHTNHTKHMCHICDALNFLHGKCQLEQHNKYGSRNRKGERKIAAWSIIIMVCIRSVSVECSRSTAISCRCRIPYV